MGEQDFAEPAMQMQSLCLFLLHDLVSVRHHIQRILLQAGQQLQYAGIEEEVGRVMTVDVDASFDETLLTVTMGGEPLIEDGAAAVAVERVQHEAEGGLAIPAESLLTELGDGAEATFHVGAL